MILLDTNVISELMRGSPEPRVASWLQALQSEPISTSVITLSEITYGLEKLPDGRRKQSLWDRFDTFIGPESGFTILPFDEAAAILSGRFRQQREAAGLHGHVEDMMIAGVAFANEASIATRNVKDFEGLGVTLINPWED